MKIESKNKNKALSSLIGETAFNKVLEKACILVENDAKQRCPVGSGELRRSITHTIEDGVGYVYTPLNYAPYVEYGTGIYSSKGGGRDGYWVFVKGSNGEYHQEQRKLYTLEEAKQIMAILRSKGLEAFYTNGQQPQPFLEPALAENRSLLDEKIAEWIKEELRNA